MSETDPLYVVRLVLTNIRCFEHLEVTFHKPGESIVLIGDNGDGKSTVLRSLAMGICDLSSASALFRELHGEYVRAGSLNGHGTIDVELAGRGRDRFRIVTKIIKTLKAFERVEQKLFRINGKRTKKLTEDDFPWDRIFATGYGPGIRVQGTSDFDLYLTVDAVYPLFRYDVLLQNPELVVRRLVDATRRRRGNKRAKDVLTKIKELLARVLQLKGPEQVYLEQNGIYVKDSSGKVGLSALADGFRGTVTWVLDLVSWWFLYRREWGTTQFLDVHGIVLIDEVEQHLHPRWQRNIMRLLTESFPHVQFISTTHSPLVASGCEGIPVHRLARGEHSIEHPFGWLAEDVYRMMGLEEGSRSALFRRDVLERVRELDLKRIRRSATSAELADLRKLDHHLSELPAADPLRAIIGMESIRRLLETPKPGKHEKTDA
jgi:energy-coupling factor transporter ATP-binding protein EcfA2